jgi:putative aldouronate transport system permease protein
MERKRARSHSDKVFDAANFILVTVVVLVCLYPLYYTVIASFSDPTDVMTGNVILLPKNVTLDSYRGILKEKTIWTGYRNTIFYATAGTLYSLFQLLPASYALSKKVLKGRKFLMGFFIFTMYFGGGMIPYYMLLKSLGLINSPKVMIIPGAFNVYYMIITRTFFETNISDSLCEAAYIDGAGELRTFLIIVLPLSGAIIAVMALYNVVGIWNGYFNALLYLSDNKYYPLQLVLRNILILNTTINTDNIGLDPAQLADTARRARLAETMKYSLIIIANLPVLVAYPFVQKYFVKGVMIGAIKG